MSLRKKKHSVTAGIDLLPRNTFHLADFHRSDGVLGSGLHLRVHLPLAALRLCAEEIHPLLRFHPEVVRERETVRQLINYELKTPKPCFDAFYIQ